MTFNVRIGSFTDWDSNIYQIELLFRFDNQAAASQFRAAVQNLLAILMAEQVQPNSVGPVDVKEAVSIMKKFMAEMSKEEETMKTPEDNLSRDYYVIVELDKVGTPIEMQAVASYSSADLARTELRRLEKQHPQNRYVIEHRRR